MARRAFISGITGQDGTYLSELLLQKGYEVHGLTRDPGGVRARRLLDEVRSSLVQADRLVLHRGELSDGDLVGRLVLDVRPNEIYNLAAQSHIGASFERPLETLDANARGFLGLLEAARALARSQDVRFFQASSSELFGRAACAPQNEETPFRPRNPYACAKAYAFFQAANYREAYDLFVCNGILFNHESPRREPIYVTRKITLAAARIAAGLQSRVTLGNLDAKRDWGYAKEYVEAMWLMLQHDEPDDYVVATNETHTIREFLGLAFGAVGLNWQDHVEVDPNLLRPVEAYNLRGDSTRIRERLGWFSKVRLPELVKIMIDSDRELTRRTPSFLGTDLDAGIADPSSRRSPAARISND